jgi:HK97 gp10 family phage protein
VDTGRLRASIDKLRVGELEWIITYAVGDPGAYYGFFQELGTRLMSPHPFLLPALDDERPNLPKGIKAEFVKL